MARYKWIKWFNYDYFLCKSKIFNKTNFYKYFYAISIWCHKKIKKVFFIWFLKTHFSTRNNNKKNIEFKFILCKQFFYSFKYLV